MTRKDYVALAEALSRVRPEMLNGTQQEIGRCEAWHSCVVEIEEVLATENPRFDRSRWIRACEGEKS